MELFYDGIQDDTLLKVHSNCLIADSNYMSVLSPSLSLSLQVWSCRNNISCVAMLTVFIIILSVVILATMAMVFMLSRISRSSGGGAA